MNHTSPAAGPDPAALPARGRKPRSPRGIARTGLSGAEHRRFLWLFMPPAAVVMLLLGWVERSWQTRPAPPAVRQVDTRIAPAADEPAVADAVLIEAEAAQPADEADDLGASRAALARVKDDTLFRGVEHEAWFQLWMTVRSMDARSLPRPSAREVSFAELYGQPASHRGRLVRFRGTLHRLEKLSAPPNEHDIREYWQGWLEPDGGPVTPIVVYFLRLPRGMPHGMRIREEVEVIGYFFKRWAYAAADAVRIAPVVLAPEPIWKPRPPASPPTASISTAALVTIAVLIAVTIVCLRMAGHEHGPRKPQQPPDLVAALADAPLLSPDEALRRLEESERGTGSRAIEGSSP